ncbi:unnamed protein product [Amoebophrya sp. A25]|nr:unnamed protein product [Amoebophrya sp. A25]|eukprot:GSA25T00011042001.1
MSSFQGFSFGQQQPKQAKAPTASTPQHLLQPARGEDTSMKRPRPEDLLAQDLRTERWEAVQKRSKKNQQRAAELAVEDEDDDDDPLAQFMKQNAVALEKDAGPQKAYVLEYEEDDIGGSAIADYVEREEQKALAALKRKTGREDITEEELQESMNSATGSGKTLEALDLKVDHSKMNYPPFEKDLYEEHRLVRAMSAQEVTDLRKELGLTCTGAEIPKPVHSFAHFRLDPFIMDVLRRNDYETPTPIQAQAVPCALKGRDVIGTAQTGSGKTLAYVLPMLGHILSQEGVPLKVGEVGPVALILCPTQDLAVQIEREIYKFGKKSAGLRSVTLAGGLSKKEQFKMCKKGCEIVVGSPGRVMDLIKMKAIGLQRVTYLVLDEADRMLDMGFEYQVTSIVKNVRPDRQTLLFSATFPPKIEMLAQNYLTRAVRIMVGQTGKSADTVEQIPVVVESDDAKLDWITKAMPGIFAQGQTLIFTRSKDRTELVLKHMHTYLPNCAPVACLHGDLEQTDRLDILGRLRKGRLRVVIATDVAARGLDIAGIRTVVCVDGARKVETHTHRVGRTGRAGMDGTAYTLLTKNSKDDARLAAHIVETLEYQQAEAQKEVQKISGGEAKDVDVSAMIPPDVLDLALSHGAFAAHRKQGKNNAVGGGNGTSALGKDKSASSSTTTTAAGGRSRFVPATSNDTEVKCRDSSTRSTAKDAAMSLADEVLARQEAMIASRNAGGVFSLQAKDQASSGIGFGSNKGKGKPTAVEQSWHQRPQEPAQGPAVGPAVGPVVGPAVGPVVEPAVGPSVGPAVGPAPGPIPGPAVGPSLPGKESPVGQSRYEFGNKGGPTGPIIPDWNMGEAAPVQGGSKVFLPSSGAENKVNKITITKVASTSGGSGTSGPNQGGGNSPSEDDSDSDDIYAPGVTNRFGKAAAHQVGLQRMGISSRVVSAPPPGYPPRQPPGSPHKRGDDRGPRPAPLEALPRVTGPTRPL